MFKKKTLPELITTFLARHNERQGKIRDRIAALETEAGEIGGKIEAVTKQLVDYELSNDKHGQAEANKTIRNLELDMDRVQGLIQSFRAESDRVVYDEKALDDIRAAAKKEREARHERERSLIASRKEAKHQIESLEAKVKELDADISRAQLESEVISLEKFIKLVNPEVAKLQSYLHRQSYLRYWIGRNDEGMQRVINSVNGDNEQPGPRVQHIKVGSYK